MKLRAGTYSFLFDIGHEDLSKGISDLVCLKQVLTGTFNELRPRLETLILEGSLLLSSFSGSIDKFRTGTKHTSHQVTFNKKRYIEIAWEVIDSLSEDYNTFNVNHLSQVFLSRDIHAITFSSISRTVAKKIDDSLKKFRPYLGCCTIDRGNPLLKQVFCDMLINRNFISNNKIGLHENSFHPDDLEGILKKTSDYSIEILSELNFHNQKPSVPLDISLSERGKKSLSKIYENSWKGHLEKVSEEFFQFSIEARREDQNASDLPEGFHDIEIPKEKLSKYALNFNHIKGKEKAKVFQKKLGLTAENSEYLALQIRDRLPHAKIETLSVSEYGIQYSARLKVEGKNGNALTVMTAWIAKPNTPARLVSIRVAKKNEQLSNTNQSDNLFIPETVPYPRRWELILVAAHKHAEQVFIKHTAQPIIVDGILYREGLCGVGVITIPDARRKICRWLLKQNRAVKSIQGIILLKDMNSDSYEKNCAYADAYSYVLELNSIEHKVEKYMD